MNYVIYPNFKQEVYQFLKKSIATCHNYNFRNLNYMCVYIYIYIYLLLKKYVKVVNGYNFLTFKM